jgi:hypothetical protein
MVIAIAILPIEIEFAVSLVTEVRRHAATALTKGPGQARSDGGTVASAFA